MGAGPDRPLGCTSLTMASSPSEPCLQEHQAVVSPDQRRQAAHARGLYPAPPTAGRSTNMRAIRRSDTKPELALRSALHAAGFRFRKDMRIDLRARRVRPDVVFTRR